MVVVLMECLSSFNRFSWLAGVACLCSSGSIELWFVLLSLGFFSSIELWFRVLFQLDRVRCRMSAYSTKSSPSSSSMSTAIWGGLLCLELSPTSQCNCLGILLW
ncbi:unnamed protein product [Microthlaspi erraticum]|uniref:Uncharacterized protein n=1 Tax=Microthlaspi erraticum TaxID=1685480 RepID=A0A6D2JUJ2_9BRAS|nr:unnamed protein product [Microthlaspi erraticum]